MVSALATRAQAPATKSGSGIMHKAPTAAKNTTPSGEGTLPNNNPSKAMAPPQTGQRVIRRNGQITEFDRSKIVVAIPRRI